MRLMINDLIVLTFAAVTAGNAQAVGSRGIQPIRLPNERGEQVELYRESHALVIGASDYTAGWPRLQGVKKDIRDVRELLARQGFNVVMVEDPTFERLKKAFDDFINRYGRDPENRLLIYFSGHGHTDRPSYGGEMGYIVPVDAANPNQDRNAFLDKALDMQQVEVYARRIQSKHALFLFDCCFSGSIFSLSKAAPENISYKTRQPVRQFITAGSADEQVPDESFFCRELLAALRGEGDRNGDGYVTGSELGEFLQEKVINYTRESQHPQYGKIRDRNLDQGDFVFQISGGMSSQSPTAPPPPSPGQSGFSVEDLKKKAAEQEALKAQWESWLGKIRTGYSEAQAVEKLDLPAADKALAWQRFIEAYGEDDTFSTEDEALRQQARKQLEYWRNYQPPVTPATQAPREYVPGRTGEVAGVPGLQMVPIPSGSFMMGSENGANTEQPVHRVTVSSFEMSATEITQAQWRAVMGYNFSYFKGDHLPVEMMSWDDAMRFCRRISEKTGQRYDLPTEAEWEYACRAGTTTTYYTGDTEKDLDRAGWYRNNSGNSTHPVGQKTANAFGLYDMHGNVWEWCQDRYGDNYYSKRSSQNPTGPGSGSARVIRGGGWNISAPFCRSASRSNDYPYSGYDDVGFRVVRR